MIFSILIVGTFSWSVATTSVVSVYSFYTAPLLKALCEYSLVFVEQKLHHSVSEPKYQVSLFTVGYVLHVVRQDGCVFEHDMCSVILCSFSTLMTRMSLYGFQYLC